MKRRMLSEDWEKIFIGEGLDFAIWKSSCIVILRFPGEKLSDPKIEKILMLIFVPIIFFFHLIFLLFFLLFTKIMKYFLIILRSRIFQHDWSLQQKVKIIGISFLFSINQLITTISYIFDSIDNLFINFNKLWIVLSDLSKKTDLLKKLLPVV